MLNRSIGIVYHRRFKYRNACSYISIVLLKKRKNNKQKRRTRPNDAFSDQSVGNLNLHVQRRKMIRVSVPWLKRYVRKHKRSTAIYFDLCLGIDELVTIRACINLHVQRGSFDASNKKWRVISLDLHFTSDSLDARRFKSLAPRM